MHYSFNLAACSLAATAAFAAALPLEAVAAPRVVFKAPISGRTISGNISQSPACEVTGNRIQRVRFYLDAAMLNADDRAPWNCNLDTRRFSNGPHVLRAVAYDSAGATSRTEIRVNIQNGQASAPASTPQPAPQPAPASGGAALDAADIIGSARADVPFAQQAGYAAQMLGTHVPVASIPEAGIHGGTLANGETQRMGKETDPLNSARKALSFQLSYSDPVTSGSKRSEISFSPNVEMNKVYWVAFRAYVRDWGNEASEGLFGTQLHSGDNSKGLSPSFGLYMSGARNFHVETRYSTASSASKSTSVTVRHADHPIKFGQWMDVVIRFKHNTAGAGFLQAWVDGQQIVDYKGNLGFNTPGYKDYFKFGIYNWASFKTPRKVLLQSPTMVLDPTGTKYSAASLRGHINK